jgi:hypothetical protein
MAQTANEILSNRKAALVISPLFYQQTLFGETWDESLLTLRHPQGEIKGWHAVPKTRDPRRDCTGEYIKIEKVNSRMSKFTVEFDATASLVAGWAALGFGVAAAATGTPQNEQQTLKSTATAGTHLFGLDHEGLSENSSPVPFNATPAELKTALESSRAFKADSVQVTGTALNHVSGLLVEFIGRLAKANLPLMSKDDTSATGGTSTVTAGQNGANKLHAITRMTSERPPMFNVIEGFVGSSIGAKLYKNLVVASIRVGFTRRGKLTVTVVAYGSAVPVALPSFVIPNCSESDPIEAGDCRFEIGGVFIADDLYSCSYVYDNNLDLDPTTAIRFDDIDIDQLRIGDRTSSFQAQIMGTDASPLFIWAQNSDAAFDDCALHCGIPGERVSFIAPYAQFSLDEQELTFVGNSRGGRSAFNLTGRPSPDPSTGIVDRVEYHGARTQQFLQFAP